MLVKCPECELQISDKARNCPHCGFPLISENITKKNRKTIKRMRLPNGFGQISEIKNKALRNPWRAMITVGKTETGKPICKILKPVGYFKTYNDAYAALAEYNKNPYDLEKEMTMDELFSAWGEKYFKQYQSQHSIDMQNNVWLYCSYVYNMQVKDVRARHIKYCMENGVNNAKRTTPHIKARIKTLFNLLFDYAVEYELTDKNYARSFKIDNEIFKEISDNKKDHIAFTDEEMSKLWDNVNSSPFVNIILIQCYTGLRPRELFKITTDNVNISNWTITGGMKTDAGKNRVIPIHSKIRKLVLDFYNRSTNINCKYLFTVDTEKGISILNYDKYTYGFRKVINNLGLNSKHRPHDPRKQFVTMAKNAKVDEYAIKKIVGHKISDITESIYTERNEDWLIEEIEKI